MLLPLTTVLSRTTPPAVRQMQMAMETLEQAEAVDAQRAIKSTMATVQALGASTATMREARRNAVEGRAKPTLPSPP